MSQKYYKQIVLSMKNVVYKTDKGILMEDITEQNYLQSDEIKEYYDFRDTPEFLNTSLELSFVSDIYTRKYMKLQDVMAQVGGLVKGVILIMCFFYHFYAETIYFYELAHNLFNFESINTNDAQFGVISVPKLNNYITNFNISANNYQNAINKENQIINNNNDNNNDQIQRINDSQIEIIPTYRLNKKPLKLTFCNKISSSFFSFCLKKKKSKDNNINILLSCKQILIDMLNVNNITFRSQ
jgi:hypothetical protein